MRIAIDFDGTLVENRFPEIGPEKLFAFATLKEIQKQGHHLILWTCRHGKELEEAVAFCRSKGIEFYSVNQDFPGEILDPLISRKIDADIYIDDRNFGGFKGWDIVWNEFRPDKHLDDVNQQIKILKLSKPSALRRFINMFKKPS